MLLLKVTNCSAQQPNLRKLPIANRRHRRPTMCTLAKIANPADVEIIEDQQCVLKPHNAYSMKSLKSICFIAALFILTILHLLNYGRSTKEISTVVHETQPREIWNDAAKANESIANASIHDIVLPNILLIGAQKSGTTSVSGCKKHL